MAPPARPFIVVLAGVNGSGKSSLGGAMLRGAGLTWFNPDALAREILAQGGVSIEEANAHAWQHGRDLLETAIAQRTNHAFETTLGAHTIPALLADASRTHDVMMIFVGLSSPEQHIDRVRWITSRENLICLLPYLARLQVFDNSIDANLGEQIPEPVLLLEMVRGRLPYPDPTDAAALARTPEWARAIVQAAIEQ